MELSVEEAGDSRRDHLHKCDLPFGGAPPGAVHHFDDCLLRPGTHHRNGD